MKHNIRKREANFWQEWLFFLLLVIHQTINSTNKRLIQLEFYKYDFLTPLLKHCINSQNLIRWWPKILDIPLDLYAKNRLILSPFLVKSKSSRISNISKCSKCSYIRILLTILFTSAYAENSFSKRKIKKKKLFSKQN